MKTDFSDLEMNETLKIIISKIDYFQVDTRIYFNINNKEENEFFDAIVAELKERHKDKSIVWVRYLAKKALKKYLDSIGCKGYLG